MQPFTTLTKSTRRTTGITHTASSNHILLIITDEPSNVSGAAMNPRVGRRQYLVTYSEADESKFFTRESFGKMLEAEFNAGTSVVKVDYWACSREEHQNNGFHYHFALKLTVCKKWLSVKNRIAEKHGIKVSFSDKHNFYLPACRYVCKSEQ